MHFSQMMTCERHTDCETFGPHPLLLLLSHWLFLVDVPSPFPHIVLQADALDDSTLHTEFSSRVYAGKRFVIWLYFLLLIVFFTYFFSFSKTCFGLNQLQELDMYGMLL